MAGQKKVVWYHSPSTPNLRIALANGSWVKFVNGNVCIGADDPLYSDKVKAIENHPCFGPKEDGARIYKVEQSIPLKTAETGMGKAKNTAAKKWNPTGVQKLYAIGFGSWFTCDKCGRKVATLAALELHAKAEHGEEYWEGVKKEAQPRQIKSYGNAPLRRRDLANDAPPPLEPPEPPEDPQPEDEEDDTGDETELPDIPPLAE